MSRRKTLEIEEKPEVKPKSNSLLLFSGVDLLFESKVSLTFSSRKIRSELRPKMIFQDEGFWGALKKISESTKIPIIFTADTVDANTGMNPESLSKREFDDFDFKQKEEFFFDLWRHDAS